VGVRCLKHWDSVEVWMDRFAEISITQTPPGFVIADRFESGGGGQWRSSLGMSQ